MTRMTVRIPEPLYEELRLVAYEQRRSINDILIERAMKKSKKTKTSLQKSIEKDLAFFRKVAMMGVQLDPVKAVREERDRDNA